jgi:hypothetical protein
MDPKATWRDIDAKEARKLLNLTETDEPAVAILGQRKIKPSVVKRYAADMAAGLWRQNPQPILLDTHGDVIDGQHRLLAVLTSTMTIRMLIVEGVDPAVRLVLDTGSGRTAFDAATVMGFNYSRRVLQISTMVLTKWLHRAPSHPEVMNFVGQHKRVLEYADLVAPTEDRRLANIPVLTVIARAGYRPGAVEKLTRFAEVLNSGVSTDESEIAIIKLRNALMQPKSMKRDEIYKKATYAIDAYLKGNKVSKLYEADPDEYLPLPDQPQKGGRA